MVLRGAHDGSPGGIYYFGLYFLEGLLHKKKVNVMEVFFGRWPSSSWSTRSLWWLRVA